MSKQLTAMPPTNSHMNLWTDFIKCLVTNSQTEFLQQLHYAYTCCMHMVIAVIPVKKLKEWL